MRLQFSAILFRQFIVQQRRKLLALSVPIVFQIPQRGLSPAFFANSVWLAGFPALLFS
jgi:ABC-type antimicrobial peptide transport system ATPase subunit